MMQRLRTHARSTKIRHQYQQERTREKNKGKCRRALIVIDGYVRLYVCACARVPSFIRLYRLTSLSAAYYLRNRRCRPTHTHTYTHIHIHNSNNTRRLYRLVCKKKKRKREREKNICITVIQLVLITRVFNEYTFLLYFFSSSFHNIRCTYKKKRQRRSIRRSFK